MSKALENFRKLDTGRVVQFIVVATLVFSIWVAFALLLINPYLHPYIPGYQVGRPCGWEFVALFASIGITYFWTRRWPGPKFLDPDGTRTIGINYGFALFLLLYLSMAVAIFVWKYSEFSAGFG